MNLIQQFQQSSAGAKAAIIVLLLSVVAIFTCACGAAAWFFLLAPGPGSDIAAPPVAVATPIPSEPTAAPTPVEFAGWRGEYFANTDL